MRRVCWLLSFVLTWLLALTIAYPNMTDATDRVTCWHSPEPTLKDVPPSSREALMEWAKPSLAPHQPTDDPFYFLCRLSYARYLVGLVATARVGQGLYLLDVSEPVESMNAVRLSGGAGSIQTLTDKSGSVYLLYCASTMHQGYGSEWCDLVDADAATRAHLPHDGIYARPPGVVTPIASSAYFSQERGCPSGQHASWFDLVVADLNGNGYPAIVVVEREWNCDTHAGHNRTVLFIPTEHGFRKVVR